jgi:hypothetical protein
MIHERFCQKLCWTFENDYNFILNHITEITFMLGFIFQTCESKKNTFYILFNQHLSATNMLFVFFFINNFTNKIVMSGRYSKSQKFM